MHRMSDSTGVQHPNFDEPIFSRTESESVVSEQGKTRSEVTELDGPDGLHLTSMGNAERFLRDHKTDVVWVQGPTRNSAGTFYCWDGQRWQADNVQAMLLAKDTVSNLEQLVAIAAENNAKSDVVKALVNFWRSCERDNKVEEILSLARWNLVIKQGQFDADPDLLGVRKGSGGSPDRHPTRRHAGRLHYEASECSVRRNSNVSAVGRISS
jgi:hypothetical protein